MGNASDDPCLARPRTYVCATFAIGLQVMAWAGPQWPTFFESRSVRVTAPAGSKCGIGREPLPGGACSVALCSQVAGSVRAMQNCERVFA